MNLLRNKPTLKYCGLTVVLSCPSRFDKLGLLTASGGTLFSELLYPDFNQMQCDIRLADDKSDLLPGTKCILLLGEYALHTWCPETTKNTLDEMRGSPLHYQNLPAIASFFPQEAADLTNHEKNYNENYKESIFRTAAESDDDSESDSKRHTSTSRNNYAFWLGKDIDKVKRLLKSGDRTDWPIEAEPIYRIYPPADEVINILEFHVGYYFEFDMETDYEEQNLLCFGFTFWKPEEEWDRRVYVVPVLDPNYHLAYSSWFLVIRALVKAIRDNTLVAHNGKCFDFLVLTAKYHIPIYKVYDTMIAEHRIYPEIEKSLGHCVSLWTYQPFHKDEDSFAYRTHEHMMTKMKYCGKDVFTMMLVHQKQIEFARRVPCLEASIELAMRSIRPYLICTLTGIRFLEDKRQARIKENDALMEQYNRIIEMLIGPVALEEIRGSLKGKAGLFPGSNKQCAYYFHTMLGYPVQGKTDAGEPAMDKKALYKLNLLVDNPVIMFVGLYRQVQKDTGALNFHIWKDDNGKIPPRTKPPQ